MAEEKQYYDEYLINFSSSNGYPTIWNGSKNVLLHRYVWEKYNGAIPEGYDIHHKDKNKRNCNIDNLELIKSNEHSRKHAIQNGLGKGNKGKSKNHISGFCGEKHPVIAIKGDLIFKFESISEASRKLGIRHSDIWRIVVGRRKTAKGWRFSDGE